VYTPSGCPCGAGTGTQVAFTAAYSDGQPLRTALKELEALAWGGMDEDIEGNPTEDVGWPLP